MSGAWNGSSVSWPRAWRPSSPCRWTWCTGAGRNRGSEREGRVLVRRLRSFGVLVTPVIPGLAWDLLRRPRPQILHVHIAHAGTPEIAALIAWVRGIPLVAHVHIDASPTTWLGCLLGLYQRLLLSKVLAHAALVLVPTASYRTLVIDKYRLEPWAGPCAAQRDAHGLP